MQIAVAGVLSRHYFLQLAVTLEKVYESCCTTARVRTMQPAVKNASVSAQALAPAAPLSSNSCCTDAATSGTAVTGTSMAA